MLVMQHRGFCQPAPRRLLRPLTAPPAWPKLETCVWPLLDWKLD